MQQRTPGFLYGFLPLGSQASNYSGLPSPGAVAGDPPAASQEAGAPTLVEGPLGEGEQSCVPGWAGNKPHRGPQEGTEIGEMWINSI